MAQKNIEQPEAPMKTESTFDGFSGVVVSDAFLKRAFDIVVSLFGLVAALPIMIVVAFAIYIDSPGPIFFRQQRLGLHGRKFAIMKFRKFPANWGSAGTGITLSADPRMTRVGAFLERTKLDELPQLWNILAGDMSFVGPRPESLRYADLFVGKYEQLLTFKPGLVGPAQIAHRSESSLYPADEDPEEYYRRVIFPLKGDMDLAYFSNTGFVRDIVTTVHAVFVTIVGTVNWRSLLRMSRQMLLRDAPVIAIAWLLANVIKFNGMPPGDDDWHALIAGTFLMPVIVVAGMIVAGCYRHLVQHFSWFDAKRLIFAVAFAWIAGYLILIGFVERGASFGLSILGLSLVVGALLFVRLVIRAQWQAQHLKSRPVPNRNLLIYGAIPGGVALANWIHGAHLGEFHLVGFLDDEPSLRQCRIHGVQVLGRESDLRNLTAVHDITELWLAFRPDAAHLVRINKICEELDIDVVDCCETYPFSELAFFDSKGHGHTSAVNEPLRAA